MITVLIGIFVLSYIAIAFEHSIKINKAASALIAAVLCWTSYMVSSDSQQHVLASLNESVGEISGILFFLLGAMVIVELIDAHDGFQILTDRIQTTSTRRLLWIIALMAFFLSAILDNLTTTIVLVSLIRKIVADKQLKLLYASLVIIAANAGGAWSPIGDVTTSMLWVGGQISAMHIIKVLFIPSLVTMFVPVLWLQFRLRKHKTFKTAAPSNTVGISSMRERNVVFFTGLLCILGVPAFKSVTHLPPFMAMLLALGLMWLITELINARKNNEDREFYTVAYALRKIDTPSILFFLGILLSIACLQHSGILASLATFLAQHLSSESMVAVVIGLFSAIVDNVPLVAATQGMYSLQQYPTDANFWSFLALTTGTGGSVLIIGSAAGVAAMGLENINFMWYLKRISLLALLGFAAGVLVFVCLQG